MNKGYWVVAYRSISDESALKTYGELAGAAIAAYDPMCMDGARHVLGDQVTFAESPEAALTGAHIAIMATAWPEFLDLDWVKVGERMSSPVLIDARNAFRTRQKPAGMDYYAIGRNYF